ncbi:MAG TPA: AAA family ATPase [Spirochaetota bacterium]|nr:AAA family ATPase [Spirochaetota bacterium]
MAIEQKNINASEQFLYDYSLEEHPLLRQELTYAINLVSKYQFTDELLLYALSLMSFDSQLEFIDLIHAYGGLSDSNDYEQVKNTLDEFRTWGRAIYKALMHGEITISQRELRQFIATLLTKERGSAISKNEIEYTNRTDTLKSLFHLSSEEIQVLNFIYCLVSINSYRLTSLTSDISFFEFLRIVSIAVSLPVMVVKQALRYDGKLYQNGIIREINVNSKACASVYLDSTIEEYLCGMSDITLLDNYISRDNESTLDLYSFTIESTSKEIIQTLLSSPSPCNILLYGIAGTGKTEFARSIVANMSKQILFLKYGSSKDELRSQSFVHPLERLRALGIVNTLLAGDENILIVDEADFLLNTKEDRNSYRVTADKGYLNQFLDNSHIKTIWISNEVGSMEESTLRRFSYSLHFKAFTEKERLNIWNNILKEHPTKQLFSDSLITSLAKEYKVNAGGIASALSTISAYLSANDSNRKNFEVSLRDVLKHHEELINGIAVKDETNPNVFINDFYDPSALNLDCDVSQFMKTINSFIPYMKDGHKNQNYSFNALFYGPSGTGKSEFVKYIASATSLPLIIKRYSDLESPYVGEAEKNIKNSFEEAQRKPSILFIDEADSFFTKRETALRSWEISRTNEFLTQMENHNGLLICCTNLLPNLDKAVMRRFSWKIEFKPLTSEAKILLYNKYFTLKNGTLTEHQIYRIKTIPDLTPGDIKAVWQRYRFADTGTITNDKIIGELEIEVAYKKDKEMKTIGF